MIFLRIACSLNSRPIKAKWFTGVCGAVFNKPLAMGLFVLKCVIDVAYTICVQLQLLVVISTHADRQSVDMSITVCLFVNLSLCTVTDFSAGDKASCVKFCTMGVLGMESPILGNFAPPEAQNLTKYVLLKKGHRIKGEGVRTPPWIRPWPVNSKPVPVY